MTSPPIRRSLLVATACAIGATALALGACGSSVFAQNSALDGAAESGIDASVADTGTGGDANTLPPEPDGGADAWTPAQLDAVDDLALWLEPSAGSFAVSNGTVTLWKDRSKNHNDAKGLVSGGPTVHAAFLNGHDTAHFEQDVVLTIDDASSLRFATDQVYIAAIVRLIPTGGLGYVFSKATAVPSGGGSQYAEGLELWAGPGSVDGGALATFPQARMAPIAGDRLAWGDAVFDDGKFHFVAVRRIDATGLSLSVDGQPPRLAQTEALGIDEVGKPVRLGGVRYGTFAQPVDFDIAEIVVVHRIASVVADSAVGNVHTYLSAKYGL